MRDNKRIFILALDGVPYSFLQSAIADGIMPSLSSLVNNNNFRQMDSVIPPISSVAWASFMTGKTPASHGIYGFIERIPQTMDVYVPNSEHLAAKTIWEYLSDVGKRVFVMNVPVTYPPKPVNGISICGFLGTDIEKGCYPLDIGQRLKANGYIIDTDTVAARDNLDTFSQELHHVYDKRVETMWEFYCEQDWDIFMAHIMETDRLHHFMWEYMEQNHSQWSPFFMDFYRKIDNLIEKVLQELKPETELMILSDHGFTTLKKEVFINKWLFDLGYLKFQGDSAPDSLHHLHPDTIAYSLIPGRIYLNVKGREKNGSVHAGLDYERIRRDLAQHLEELVDPGTGEPMINRILTREECYMTDCAEKITINNQSILDQNNPFYLAPDLLVINEDGYDFKGNLWRENLVEKGPIVGTHTYDDAFFLVKDKNVIDNRFSIMDAMPTILDLMGVEIPTGLDGKSVILDT